MIPAVAVGFLVAVVTWFGCWIVSGRSTSYYEGRIYELECALTAARQPTTPTARNGGMHLASVGDTLVIRGLTPDQEAHLLFYTGGRVGVVYVP